jgi:hypothetical protein
MVQPAIHPGESDEARQRHGEQSCKGAGQPPLRATRNDHCDTDEQHRRGGGVPRRERRRTGRGIQTRHRGTRPGNDKSDGEKHRDLDDERQREEHGLAKSLAQNEKAHDQGGSEHNGFRVERPRRDRRHVVPGCAAVPHEPLVDVLVPPTDSAVECVRQQIADAEHDHGQREVAGDDDVHRRAQRPRPVAARLQRDDHGGRVPPDTASETTLGGASGLLRTRRGFLFSLPRPH